MQLPQACYCVLATPLTEEAAPILELARAVGAQELSGVVLDRHILLERAPAPAVTGAVAVGLVYLRPGQLLLY